MTSRTTPRRAARIGGLVSTLAILALLTASPVSAAGFGIFEQGSKAMGMAGAFTAQADDGSAIFHNVAGLGFLEEREFDVGVTLITNTTNEFDGADPFPGMGVMEEGEDQLFTPIHVYYAKPIGNMTVGLGINNPFGLATEWKNPDTFSGRFISTRAELVTFDFTPSLAWRFGNAAFGISGVARAAKVELERHVPFLNPFSQTVLDIAEVNLESDFDFGYGFNVGFLHKPSDRLSWGISYRSSIEVDFEGDGRFTQRPTGNPALDAAIAAGLPFDQDLPVETSIDFPDMASLGVAFAVGRNSLIEIDANWTGWSSFKEVNLVFPQNPDLSSTLEQNYDDAWNYRIGYQYTTGGGNAIRLGYVYDESPQPDEGVGPLLPDSDRNGFTVGFGWGERFDLALMYLPFDERTTTTNRDQYYGTWNTTAFLLGATLRF